MKKVYKLKFNHKPDKNDFLDYTTDYPSIIDDSKRKSVIIKAKNKDKVREMIVNAEKGEYPKDAICFGWEGRDYTITKIADNEDDYDLD